MGTWDHGLLDNDIACDGVADLAYGVLTDIERLGAEKATAATTATLAAAVGVYVQLAPHAFEDGVRGGKVVLAVQPHARGFARLPAPAAKWMERVAAGKLGAIARGRAAMPASEARLLHVGARRAPFGRAEPALFATRQGASYVRTTAWRCVQMIDEDFEDESNWSDLCREGSGMGGLAALMVLAPCRVAVRKLEGWRRKARRGLAELEAAEDEELSFQRRYYANLDGVFAAVLRRFAA